MNKSKGPLVVVLSLVAVSGYLVVHDAFQHQVDVKALDGSSQVIEIDPSRIQAKGQADASSLVGTRKYGVSEKPDSMPTLPGNEVNMSGTTVR